MLVSADAGPGVRGEVAAGQRPCPEFLRLEQRYGVRLLDWSLLRAGPGGRSAARSLDHVAAAVPLARRATVVLSDGEHLGIPLAALLRSMRIGTPHLVIGHRPATPAKQSVARAVGAHRRMDRVVVHAGAQVEPVRQALRLPADAVRVVPYGVDTAFWSAPAGESADVDEALVVAAGREHRDYDTLARACAGEPVQVVVSGGSAHSPNARRRAPAAWPVNVQVRRCAPPELRSLYRRAAVVVVPLVPCDFPAGITVLLEAMAMGKAVVVTGTGPMREVVEDGVTGLVVPPADPGRLRDAIRRLREHPADRVRLGVAARAAAVGRYGLDSYVERLAGELNDLGGWSTRSSSRKGLATV